jgi:hypothetical protein
MSDREFDWLVATIESRLTRVLWLWGLGVVWLTLLIAGAVLLLLWAR